MIDRDLIMKWVGDGRLEWRRHALMRMGQRGIRMENVLATLKEWDLIEDYPDAYPIPAALLFGYQGDNIIHVVAAFDKESRKVYIISAYFADEEKFEKDLRTRKEK